MRNNSKNFSNNVENDDFSQISKAIWQIIQGISNKYTVKRSEKEIVLKINNLNKRTHKKRTIHSGNILVVKIIPKVSGMIMWQLTSGKRPEITEDTRNVRKFNEKIQYKKFLVLVSGNRFQRLKIKNLK
ncbi:hypothetical protein Glove_346g32 [Diversispora epigaea]|uniref:Uncharacterized protein n=1 Tax=Diversispora epigaea TaxID=1348612 RepID=A0A397HFV0_9GLOM|nr:hypothetical protein Glove_346g32 [Diversispora epigaea]